MMCRLRPVSGLANVYFSHPKYDFEELCEAAFLREVFTWLQAAHGRVSDRFEFVVFADEGTPQAEPRPPGERPTILWHISDEAFATTLKSAQEFAAILRCYMPADRAGGAIATPLGTATIGTGRELTELVQRPTPLFFSGNLHQRRVCLYLALRGWPAVLGHPTAQRATAAILQRTAKLELDDALPGAIIRFTTGFRSGLPPAAFVKDLENAKIALCPEGAITNETFRHYEALRAGCVVISAPLPDTWYYRTSPIIQLSDWRRLSSLIRELLNSADEMERLGGAARRWWRDAGSPRAVAGFIAEQIADL